MPAKKPIGLHDSAATKESRKSRQDGESALRPSRDLPLNPPRELESTVARRVWRYLMKRYSEMEAEIVTSLDRDLLVDYCILAGQVFELDQLRAISFIARDVDTVIKIDARSERKRAHMQKLRESLYLTPRSRAGVAPEKKVEEPEDALDELLNEFVDHASKGNEK
jgi:phage terminase small subunit